MCNGSLAQFEALGISIGEQIRIRECGADTIDTQNQSHRLFFELIFLPAPIVGLPPVLDLSPVKIPGK